MLLERGAKRKAFCHADADSCLLGPGSGQGHLTCPGTPSASQPCLLDPTGQPGLSSPSSNVGHCSAPGAAPRGCGMFLPLCFCSVGISIRPFSSWHCLPGSHGSGSAPPAVGKDPSLLPPPPHSLPTAKPRGNFQLLPMEATPCWPSVPTTQSIL